jgi:acetoin utilization deacetylase AcuC-like enzyme
MILFKPNLVIISAGFDAHDDDPLASLELTDEDFGWATEIILAACVEIDSNSPIPCISVLEGGYDLDAISRSASIHCRVLANGYPEVPVGEAALAVDHLKKIGVFD